MASYLHWNKEEALYHLCGSLEGAADQILWDIGPLATTANVIQLLQTRFGTQIQAERFKAELRTTLQTLYQDICRLVTLGYPSADVTLTNDVGKEAFITALNDGHRQHEVMKCEPVNIKAALSCAIKLETYEQSLVHTGTLTSEFGRESG